MRTLPDGTPLIEAAPAVPTQPLDAVCVTPSTHLATMLGTCDAKLRLPCPTGPERTPSGEPVVKFVFDETAEVKEIMMLWGEMNRNPPPPTWNDWSKLSDEQRQIVMNFVTAFSQNLHWYMKLAKNGGRVPR